MMIRPLIPLAGIAIASAVWFYRVRKRKLPPPQAIIEAMFPGESQLLERYITDLDLDLIAHDLEFYRDFGGWEGFKRKRANARAIVRLCEALSESPDCEINPEDIKFMTNRAMLILFHRSCSMLESMVRIFLSELPHSSARITAQLYWEMEIRLTTLCPGEIKVQLSTML